jgi:hypothetical protein
MAYRADLQRTRDSGDSQRVQGHNPVLGYQVSAALILCSGIAIKKLTVAQLVKAVSAVYGAWKCKFQPMGLCPEKAGSSAQNEVLFN